MRHTTSDDEPSISIPAGPFYANWGPRDGLIPIGGAPVMGVLDGRRTVVGGAWLAGSIPSRKESVQLWRLEVSKVADEGVWVCCCRQFVRLGDAAESV